MGNQPITKINILHFNKAKVNNIYIYLILIDNAIIDDLTLR